MMPPKKQGFHVATVDIGIKKLKLEESVINPTSLP